MSDPEVSADVIDSCRRGDRQALRTIYERYQARVYSLAFYFFHGDVSIASDVTQQVFLKVMTQISHFRGDSEFSTWLYRLAVNTCTDHSRRSKSQVRAIGRWVPETISNAAPQEEYLAQAQLARSVQLAISALPARFRIAILLRYFEDLSYEEIAKTLNCSMGTVASRLSRGHRILAEKLGPLKGWFTTGTRDVR